MSIDLLSRLTSRLGRFGLASDQAMASLTASPSIARAEPEMDRKGCGNGRMRGASVMS
ncbi:MAG: hypothetical protein ACREO8_14115 [Luteimonas sp.]